MNLGIAAIDGLATCFFFSGALMAVVNHRLSRGRTPLWAYTAVAFALLAVERAANTLEWSGASTFATLDAIQGYLSVVACIVIALLPLRFWLLTRRVGAGQSQ
ncbi:MAG TPA: hypothetical protein DGT21_13150 [Armatimonadetes bacterium]|jgi:hypothetical protein|nr:hypothetical protein [Armatimonadota bacterium]